jgi:hypothetical protein
MPGGNTPGNSSMGRSPSVSRGANRPLTSFLSGAVGDQEDCITAAKVGGTAGNLSRPCLGAGFVSR